MERDDGQEKVLGHLNNKSDTQFLHLGAGGEQLWLLCFYLPRLDMTRIF